MPRLDPDGPAAILITVNPGAMALQALRTIDTFIALGDAARESLVAFSAALGVDAPHDIAVPERGEILCWRPRSGQAPRLVMPRTPAQAHKRHKGKYAAGDVGEHHGFYFRGPRNALNLPARNLYHFLSVGLGIDDEIWDFHLRSGHYSAWFRHVIKDEDLAREAAGVEQDLAINADTSRQLIKKAIWQRYAAPVENY